MVVACYFKYNDMKLKTLPKTSILVSPLTYGAFAAGGWFWGGADVSEAVAAIETAISHGITTIDTAPVYGMGQSEALVGNTIKGKRKEVQVLTKFGMRWDTRSGDFTFDSKDNDGNPVKIYKFNGKQSVLEECERSLKRLQTDYIDLYQMHWPESTTPIEETMEALEILQQQGKILAGGVCNCPVDLLERAGKQFPVSTNQVAYSLLNRSIEQSLLPYCIENNIGILSHTTLQKGLLTGKIKPGHHFNEGDHRANNAYFTDTNLRKIQAFLDAIQPVADERGVTLGQLSINWAMQQPGVTSVLVGARNSEQMEDNIKAVNFTLTPTELDAINKAAADLHLDL